MSDYIPVGNFNLNYNWEEEATEMDMDSMFLERFGIKSSDFDEEMEEEGGQVTSNSPRRETEETQEFALLKDEDIQTFIRNEENKNTAKKTQQDVKKFEKFLRTIKNESRPFAQIPPDELDTLIANYILSAKRVDGTEYEPTTVRNMVSSLDRTLKRQRYPYSIMNERGPAFQLTRDTLKAKQKSLKKMGKGNKENAAKPLTDQEIDILYSKGFLGCEKAFALLNTVWLNNTMHFGLRGTTENYTLRWGDITLHTDSVGTEYLELKERQTKTRTGENVADIRSVTPKMFANKTNPNRDPVAVYKLYASKRPIGYSQPSDPFYIAPRTVDNHEANWFIRQPVGQRKLSGMMKNMALGAGLDTGKKITNHSARKTLVQKLRNAGVAPTAIMQISGHKNLTSVLNYSEMAVEEQRTCSNILSSSSSVSLETRRNENVTLENPQSTYNHTNNLMQSVFAGATLNVQNLHVHMQ